MSESREKVLRCISRHIARDGWAPSRREIARECGLSVSTVHAHVKRLEEQGFIQLGVGSRQIRLVSEREEVQ